MSEQISNSLRGNQFISNIKTNTNLKQQQQQQKTVDKMQQTLKAQHKEKRACSEIV